MYMVILKKTVRTTYSKSPKEWYGPTYPTGSTGSASDKSRKILPGVGFQLWMRMLTLRKRRILVLSLVP